MRTVLSVLFFCLTLASPAQCCMRRDTCRGQQPGEEVSPSTLILWYEPSGKKHVRRAIRKYRAEVIYDYRNFNGFAIRIPEGTAIEDAIRHFQGVRGVLSVNRDRVMHLTTD